MRKLALLLLVVLAALATIVIRIQPRGQATIFRRGNHLTVRARPVYIRPLAYDSRCRAPLTGGRLTIETTAAGVSATGDDVEARVRFTYELPETMSPDWQTNDWCMALDGEVGATFFQWAQGETDGALLDRRAAGDRAAAVVAHEVATVHPANVSVRIELPPGCERLRAVDDVAAGAPARTAGDLHRPRRRRLAAARHLHAGGRDADAQTPRPRRHGRRSGNRASAALADALDDNDDRRVAARARDPRLHPIQPHHARERADHQRRAARAGDLEHGDAGGKQTAVFGLWATYPAEPVHGLNVTDRMANFLYTDRQRPAGVVYPPSRQP